MRRGCLVSLLLIGLLQTSCEGRRKPSILVIAVDRLPFHLSLCAKDAESENSGFQTLCDESIRFTHALTTSTMSVPALASVLTGTYPVKNGVRQNGGPGLSPRFRTVAEAALRRGFRSAFFSGGAPVWRRSGLHQGFEIFDDNVNFPSGRLFRSFAETKNIFETWLRQEVEEKSFLSVIYAPDLDFPDTVTETPTGEIRNLSYESQFEELDESLYELFRFLKKRDRWNDTAILVVGLNGREISPRPREVEPVLLNSENTQVSLFIKPAIKARDEAIHWTIDRNVSLADLGKTLFALVSDSLPAKDDSAFPVFSLVTGLTSAQPDWPEDRPLLTESAWTSWHGLGPIRAAVLKNFELMIYDEKPMIYNTLTDRMEMAGLRGRKLDVDVTEKLRLVGFQPWPGLPHSASLLFQIPTLNWLTQARSPAWHRQLVKLSQNSNADERILRWTAQSCLEQKDWITLERIATGPQHLLWKQIAQRNLGKKVVIDDVCLSLLAKKDALPGDLKVCPDETFLSLLHWVRADLKGDGRDLARRRFLKAWENAQQDLRILKANAGLGLLWLPASAEDALPSRTSLALSLGELRRFVP